MQPLPITSLLLIALAFGMVLLSAVTIRRRRRAGISVGDGGDESLTRAIRAQGNMFESSVVFVGLIALLENGLMGSAVLAPLAAMFVLSRAIHAYGILVAEPRTERGQGRFRWRVLGISASLTLMSVAAILLLVELILDQVIVF